MVYHDVDDDNGDNDQLLYEHLHLKKLRNNTKIF
jgi:hypothetical protein